MRLDLDDVLTWSYSIDRLVAVGSDWPWGIVVWDYPWRDTELVKLAKRGPCQMGLW